MVRFLIKSLPSKLDFHLCSDKLEKSLCIKKTAFNFIFKLVLGWRAFFFLEEPCCERCVQLAQSREYFFFPFFENTKFGQCHHPSTRHALKWSTLGFIPIKLLRRQRFFLLTTYFKNFVTEENNREGVHEKREKYDREYFFCKALATALNFVSATSKCLYVRFSWAL